MKRTLLVLSLLVFIVATATAFASESLLANERFYYDPASPDGEVEKLVYMFVTNENQRSLVLSRILKQFGEPIKQIDENFSELMSASVEELVAVGFVNARIRQTAIMASALDRRRDGILVALYAAMLYPEGRNTEVDWLAVRQRKNSEPAVANVNIFLKAYGYKKPFQELSTPARYELLDLDQTSAVVFQKTGYYLSTLEAEVGRPILGAVERRLLSGTNGCATSLAE